MNAVIRAVVRKGIYHGLTVFGVERGYEGVLHGDFIPLALKSVAGIIQHGGTMLRTARSEDFKTDLGFQMAVKQLKDRQIDSLIVVGGDGSMAGAAKLGEAGISTVVIPGTIDNDMPGTEYTIGFDTALNTVLDAVNKIRDTAASHERVAVVEVMGRSAGHIALLSGIASGAEFILLPEQPVDMDAVCQGLMQTFSRGKLYSIIVVAEGAGEGHAVASEIAKRTSFKPGVTVLGYIQRGGSPSAYDNIMGSRMGAMAIDSLLEGQKNFLVAYQRGQIIAAPYADAFKQKQGIDLSLHELAGILAM
jgi:6-phosphofructokinase 1